MTDLAKKPYNILQNKSGTLSSLVHARLDDMPSCIYREHVIFYSTSYHPAETQSLPLSRCNLRRWCLKRGADWADLDVGVGDRRAW